MQQKNVRVGNGFCYGNNIELNLKIAQEIARRRKLQGLLQKDLAKKLNISNAAMTAVESQPGAIKVQTLKRICDALECTLAEFFSFTEEEQPQMNGSCALKKAFREFQEAITPYLEEEHGNQRK